MNETSADKRFDYIDHLKNARKLWYIVGPSETSFQLAQDVPNYYLQVWFSFFVLVMLEHVVLFTKNEKSFRINDQVTSLSHWLFQESIRIVSRGAEHGAYVLVYDRYRLWSLAWDDPWTWYIAMMGVDFCYYWVHRANHEIHFLWAQHQVHHSSEEFNLVVGLRQSVFQHWFTFMFYLPLALFLPPSHFVVHHQFNLIYQFWIHTTVVKNLGILEFFLNTPKHHRVHHGCNLYCLDKNYGGVFILWDRIFGTFADEKLEEKIIYGLVSSPRSFNPLYLQTFYTGAMIRNFGEMKSLSNKLGVLWKGPSWFPGAPRLGLDECKINVRSRSIYDVRIARWKNLYATLQFCMIFYTHCRELCTDKADLRIGAASEAMILTNNVLALTVTGMLFDDSKYAPIVELARCVLFLIVSVTGGVGLVGASGRDANFRTTSSAADMVLYFYAHVASCCLWVVYILRNQLK